VSVECGRIVRTHCLARLLFLWLGLVDFVLVCFVAPEKAAGREGGGALCGVAGVI
jgi:hypothetical protein